MGPVTLSPQSSGGPPTAGLRGERVFTSGSGRELSGYPHPHPQALHYAPGPHQPALRVSVGSGYSRGAPLPNSTLTEDHSATASPTHTWEDPLQAPQTLPQFLNQVSQLEQWGFDGSASYLPVLFCPLAGCGDPEELPPCLNLCFGVSAMAGIAHSW